MRLRSVWLAALFLVVLGLDDLALADLNAQELALLVNKNVPEGRQLAEFYAQARGVPAGRIIELDLPTGDEMSRTTYEQVVVPEVRRFLLDAGLRKDVRCLVTFYGVPLAVGGKKLTPAERQERQQVNRQAEELAGRLAPLLGEAEELLRPLGYAPPAIKPSESQRLDVLLARFSAVESHLSQQAGSGLNPQQRQELAGGVARLRERFESPLAPDGGRLSREEFLSLARQTDAEGRRSLREALRARAPLRAYAEALYQHQRILSEEQSHASLDSELATLWLENVPASSWIPNPLTRSQPAGSQEQPNVLMVSRLDGRDPQQVRDLVATSVRIERDGIAGKIVVDSRGIAPLKADGQPDGYGVFDEELRRLADFLRQNASVTVFHDDGPDVIAPPGQADVAVYVGWYSLAKYIRGMQFAPGAVGYHVASLEMRSLRDPPRTGWVRGLLDDGVVATTGPVAEPYLTAFPPPGEFVPLLLSGQLTLAEVYWRTVPLMSWQMGLIGDPLYSPFAAKPGLSVEKLPPHLRLKLDGEDL